MNNQECKVRPEFVDVSTNNPIFYPFSTKVKKCSGNCNNINDPSARICAPDIVKSLNVKIFILMTLTNETRHIEWHERSKCVCRLDGIVRNDKQRWNEDKRRCECKELIDKRVCDKGYDQNPGNCKCECDKSCCIGEYINYEIYKCRKKLVDPLIEECTVNINETSLVKKKIDKIENKDKCNSYVVYKM